MAGYVTDRFSQGWKNPGRDYSSTMWLRLEGGNNYFAAKLKPMFQYFPYRLLEIEMFIQLIQPRGREWFCKITEKCLKEQAGCFTATMKTQYLNCSKGKAFPLQARLWPRGWAEV